MSWGCSLRLAAFSAISVAYSGPSHYSNSHVIADMATTLLLFAYAPLKVWSLFVNFCALTATLRVYCADPR